VKRPAIAAGLFYCGFELSCGCGVELPGELVVELSGDMRVDPLFVGVVVVFPIPLDPNGEFELGVPVVPFGLVVPPPAIPAMACA